MGIEKAVVDAKLVLLEERGTMIPAKSMRTGLIEYESSTGGLYP